MSASADKPSREDLALARVEVLLQAAEKRYGVPLPEHIGTVAGARDLRIVIDAYRRALALLREIRSAPDATVQTLG